MNAQGLLQDILIQSLVVVALSVVQSVFGIGLLLLGTPLLILLGMPFEQVLWVLLPASVTVSTLQLALDRGITRGGSFTLIFCALPTLVVGLMVVLGTRLTLKMDSIVGGLLILGGILRLFSGIRRRALEWLKTHDRMALAGIGLVHGLTNMGGGLLSLYSSVRYTTKFEIRQQIALGYAMFAATQLLVLVYAGTATRDRLITAAILACAAGVTFVTVGRAVFQRVSSAHYNIHFSLFEIGCGFFLIVRRLIALSTAI